NDADSRAPRILKSSGATGIALVTQILEQSGVSAVEVLSGFEVDGGSDEIVCAPTDFAESLARQSVVADTLQTAALPKLLVNAGVRRLLVICDREYDAVETLIRIGSPGVQMLRHVIPISEHGIDDVSSALRLVEEASFDGV